MKAYKYLPLLPIFPNRLWWQQNLHTLPLIAISLLLISYLHYSTAPGISQLHAVYRYFYFLPLVYGALRFGYWGGLLTALATTLAFIPHILLRWDAHTLDAFNDLLVVFVFFGVALITGITTDRMRQAQTEQTQTAVKLAASLERVQTQGEALRRAERLSSLGTLAGGLAHEIRNPMGIISASAQLLEMECGEAATETVAVIRHETGRVEQLIQELLNYAGDSGPKLARSNVCHLIEQVCKRLQPIVDASGTTLRFEVQRATRHDVVPDEPFEVDWDADQIEQALINLCMNAVQALGGPGTITMTAARTLDPRPTTQLTVTDDGPGISQLDLPRIFDPFYSTRDNGAGLGLSVVQRIANDHEGHIWVESELGAGATFIMELPVRVPK